MGTQRRESIRADSVRLPGNPVRGILDDILANSGKLFQLLQPPDGLVAVTESGF